MKDKSLGKEFDINSIFLLLRKMFFLGECCSPTAIAASAQFLSSAIHQEQNSFKCFTIKRHNKI